MTALAILLLCAPPPDTGVRITVQVSREVALDPEEFLAALRLRLRHTSIRTALWSGDDSFVGDWRVVVSRPSRDRMYLSVSSAVGQILLAKNLAVAGRHPTDLAHTLALLVVEALTPAIPELLEKLPVIEQVESAPVEMAAESSESDKLRWSWEAGLSAAVLWPSRALVFGPRAGLMVSWGNLVVENDLVGWSPQTYRTPSLRLAAWQGTARLGVGATWRLAQTDVLATLGPAVRFALAEAEGAGVLFEHRTLIEPGLGLRCGARLRFEAGALSLAVAGYHYLENARFVVDGARVADLGRWALALVLAFSSDF